ncbi:hypothetical protein PG988_015840 [Apiospora saccharicola]
MTDRKESFSAQSISDDEESSAAGLLSDTVPTLRGTQRSTRTKKAFRLYLVLIHVILLAFVLITAILGQLYMGASPTPLNGSTWSPVQEFVEYEVKDRDTHGHDAPQTYAGKPTPEKDKAWDALIRPAYFNATVEELERAGESLQNVTHLTGGGYLASIGVYHELHCVRQLWFYVYKDRYYPNLSEKDERYLQIHLDHCIESLRETIMCSGNTALISFFWDNPKASQPAAQSNARSKCASWDSIERWGYSRRVSTSPDFRRPPVNDEE